MKYKSQFLLFTFCSLLFVASVSHAAPVSPTDGSNLTGFAGNMGAINNNQWNNIINSRTAPAADFGNCNALILRCAQPKCATGGCLTMEIAYPIVNGCVISSKECAPHGETLTQTIAAQLVANATARANEQSANATATAAAQNAAQSDAVLQQMQSQMAQMQQQMESQNATALAAQQAALDEQRKLIEQQNAKADVPTETAVATSAATVIANGVSADVIAREQIGGQIMTQLENAEVALKSLNTTMQGAFEYAGCDRNGSNCVGPKRVKAFKQKAGEFFDPYNTVLDEVYDAIILAQSLGVDISDIYMMLNGSCNAWGKYMCDKIPNCNAENNEDCYYTVESTMDDNGNYRVNPKQQHCTLIQMMTDRDEAQQNWLDMGQGSSGGIRVACASDAIENSVLFRNRKKQASINIEVLERIIDQDAPNTIRDDAALQKALQVCAVADIEDLQKAANLKRLPAKVCMTDGDIEKRDVDASVHISGESRQTLTSMYNGFVLDSCIRLGGKMGTDGQCNCTGSDTFILCFDATHKKTSDFEFDAGQALHNATGGSQFDVKNSLLGRWAL